MAEVSDTWYKVTCGACPLQIEGELYGHPFYYRSRWGYYRIVVTPPGVHPNSNDTGKPLVCIEGRGGDTPEEAMAIIVDAGIRLNRILSRR